MANAVELDPASEFENARTESLKLEQTLAAADRNNSKIGVAIKDAETLFCYYQADPGSVTAAELRQQRLRLV